MKRFVKIMVFAIGAWTGFASFAESVDLATYWIATPDVKQTLSEGEYTLSSDYAIPVALDLQQGSIFDFSSGGHVFTVGGDTKFVNPYHDKTTILKGGTWNVGTVQTDFSGTSFDGYRLVLDGATVNTPRVFFVPGGAVGNCGIVLTNGATLNVTGSQYSEFCRKRTSSAYSFLLDICGGSTLGMTNDFTFVYTGGDDEDVMQNNTLRVRGAGSCIAEKGALFIGQYSPGNRLEVLDGATVQASWLYLGKGGHSHDNTIVISGANSHLSATYPKIGEYETGAKCFSGTSNNWVYVLDGGKFTASTDYQKDCELGPYSANNGIYVSNGTLKASSVLIGRKSEAASNNMVRVTGQSAVVNMSFSWESHNSTPWMPFGAGPRCSFLLEGGSTFNAKTFSKGFDINGTNCLFRVAGEAANPESPNLDLQYFYLTGRNNTLEVLDGAWMRVYCSYMERSDVPVGSDCSIVVSNATLSCCQYYGIFVQGAGNRLVLEGAHPVVKSTCGSNFYLYNGGRLDFVLPVGSNYDPENPPLQFNGIYVTDGTHGDAEATGADPVIGFPNLEEYRSQLDEAIDLTLAKANAFDNRMKRVVSDVSATLPKGCTLSVTGTNKLVLHIARPPKGLLLLYR